MVALNGGFDRFQEKNIAVPRLAFELLSEFSAVHLHLVRGHIHKCHFNAVKQISIAHSGIFIPE